MEVKMPKPELLIPAGNLEKLRTAIFYGADAVYVGIVGLSLRAASAELGRDELRQGVREAHQAGVKVYVAMNAFARDADLSLIGAMTEELTAIGIDAVIISDPGVLRVVREVNPQLPLHLSTQANTTNSAAVRFWQEQGVKRVVLARELQLAEIAAVHREAPAVELEVFIHGAMCVAYSGRCFLSAHRNRRSANRGDCTQPCRWEYAIAESTRPDDPLLVEADGKYTYLLNSKDLWMIEHLPEVLQAGVTGLKVEGRMKSAYYVALVTRTYRQALDALLRDPEQYVCQPEWLEELRKISHRGYTTGFYFSKEMIRETTPERKYTKTHDLIGTVLEYDPVERRILVGVRNHLAAGDEVELLLPGTNLPVPVDQMTDPNGMPLKIAHNGYQVYFPVKAPVPAGAVLRRQMD
jgi:putative protease